MQADGQEDDEHYNIDSHHPPPTAADMHRLLRQESTGCCGCIMITPNAFTRFINTIKRYAVFKGEKLRIQLVVMCCGVFRGGEDGGRGSSIKLW